MEVFHIIFNIISSQQNLKKALNCNTMLSQCRSYDSFGLALVFDDPAQPVFVFVIRCSAMMLPVQGKEKQPLETKQNLNS